MEYRWNDEKDAWLRAERGVGFKELLTAFENAAAARDREHHQPDRRPAQRVLWIPYRDQVWVIPYVIEDKHVYFLKTAYPSRKAARQFKSGGAHEKA